MVYSLTDLESHMDVSNVNERFRNGRTVNHTQSFSQIYEEKMAPNE